MSDFVTHSSMLLRRNNAGHKKMRGECRRLAGRTKFNNGIICSLRTEWIFEHACKHKQVYLYNATPVGMKTNNIIVNQRASLPTFFQSAALIPVSSVCQQWRFSCPDPAAPSRRYRRRRQGLIAQMPAGPWPRWAVASVNFSSLGCRLSMSVTGAARCPPLNDPSPSSVWSSPVISVLPFISPGPLGSSNAPPSSPRTYRAPIVKRADRTHRADSSDGSPADGAEEAILRPKSPINGQGNTLLPGRHRALGTLQRHIKDAQAIGNGQ